MYSAQRGYATNLRWRGNWQSWKRISVAHEYLNDWHFWGEITFMDIKRRQQRNLHVFTEYNPIANYPVFPCLSVFCVFMPGSDIAKKDSSERNMNEISKKLNCHKMWRDNQRMDVILKHGRPNLHAIEWRCEHIWSADTWMSGCLAFACVIAKLWL